jgi:hypothetical protein
MSKRYAKITKTWATRSSDQIEAYLPANYEVLCESSNCYYIHGEDNAGWTLEDYVIPRLASGCIIAEEITEADALARGILNADG